MIKHKFYTARQTVWLAFGLALVHTTVALGAGSSGGAATSAPTTGTQRSAEQQAIALYNSGLRHKRSALKAEGKAAKATKESRRNKYVTRANKEYKKAAEKHLQALKLAAGLAEAANELGYALRKIGDYGKALSAYNHALGVRPDFAEAKEYKAEALLALGEYEQAKELYLDLFRTAPAQAALLMTSFQMWLAEPRDGSSIEAESFARWITQRADVARAVTPDVSPAEWDPSH